MKTFCIATAGLATLTLALTDKEILEDTLFPQTCDTWAYVL